MGESGITSDMIDSDVRIRWRGRELQMAGLSVSAVGNQPLYDGIPIGIRSATRDIQRATADGPISDGTIDSHPSSGDNFYIPSGILDSSYMNGFYPNILSFAILMSLYYHMRLYLVRSSVIRLSSTSAPT